MSYQSYYPNGWQSGESGKTPITPEALQHMENGIKNAAPAGYGLGGSGISANDLNEALQCGFLAWGSDCANTPFNYGMGITINRFDGRYTQLLFNPWMSGCGEIVVRHFDGTEWLPDEWVNPPMISGVEYRTTERFWGKAVYVKRISYGNLPASGPSHISTGISDATCVSIMPTFFSPSKNAEPYPIMGESGAKCLCWMNTDCSILYVQAISDVSTFTGEFIIKYTKD